MTLFRRGTFIFFLCLSGCGVKLPPIAPQRDPEPVELNLDCSPSDPACDKEDLNYRPKSPRPAAAPTKK